MQILLTLGTVKLNLFKVPILPVDFFWLFRYKFLLLLVHWQKLADEFIIKKYEKFKNCISCYFINCRIWQQ
jgi:hypothetical protein